MVPTAPRPPPPAPPPWRRTLPAPARSFFLFGPRGVGKSTWLREHYAAATSFDLLRSELFLGLSRRPEELEARVGDRPRGHWVCIDEVQKLPGLLDEVHRLMEARGWRFALTGSSARRLRRGGTNLLGGRAVTLEMGPLTAAELGDDFDLDRVLEWGALPQILREPGDAPALLDAYVHTYLREEVRQEGLIRRVEPFTRFLEVAGILGGQILNLQNVAAEAHVPRASVDVYFGILEDTLLGRRLRPYQPGARVREVGHPKFYWFDCGVARAAAGLTREPVDRAWKDFAFETWLLGELSVYNHTSGKARPLHYWRTGAGVEVDFVVETRRKTMSRPTSEVVCIEAKVSSRWDRRWEEGARALATSGAVRVARMFGVYAGDARLTYDGFVVLPVRDFVAALGAGEIF
jgi:predicted AAA+ superfamily ATPase